MTITRRTFLQATGAATVAALMPRRSFAAMGDSLCRPVDATVTAVRSGSWQDVSTWNGHVPVAGDRVYIPTGINVSNHGVTADVLWIHVAGTLSVCHCDNPSDAQFNVHTIYVPMGGKVDFGDVQNPMRAKCVVEWLPGNFLTGDTTQLSRGLICHGEFMACGQSKAAWGPVLNPELKVGATSLKVSDAGGWKAGDRLVVCGTDSLLGENRRDHVYQSESVTVQSVLHASDGAIVQFSPALKYRHFRWHPDLPFHVGNLTRNVVFRSRDTSALANRGHLMFMSPMCRMFSVAVEGCGRTDGSQPVTDPRFDAYGEMVPGSDANVRARYAVHWHRIGQLSAQAVCSGCVVDGSPKWGFLNHDSNVRVSDCIATRCFGSGFATEEGQERGAFDHCLSVLNRGEGDYISSTDEDHGRQLIGDWGTDGSGFWLQGGMVDVTDCVSCDNSGRGFGLFNKALNGYPNYGSGNPVVAWMRYPITVDGSLLGSEYGGTTSTPSSTVPQRVFARNTAYGNKVGLQAWSGPTHDASGNLIWPLSVRGSITDLTLWGRGARFNGEYLRQENVDGLRIVGDRNLPNREAFLSSDFAVLLRSPEVTVRNWQMSGVQGTFTIEGANDPGGIPAKNIVIENWP
jgi:hypothetical protein